MDNVIQLSTSITSGNLHHFHHHHRAPNHNSPQKHPFLPDPIPIRHHYPTPSPLSPRSLWTNPCHLITCHRPLNSTINISLTTTTSLTPPSSDACTGVYLTSISAPGPVFASQSMPMLSCLETSSNIFTQAVYLARPLFFT